MFALLQNAITPPALARTHVPLLAGGIIVLFVSPLVTGDPWSPKKGALCGSLWTTMQKQAQDLQAYLYLGKILSRRLSNVAWSVFLSKSTPHVSVRITSPPPVSRHGIRWGLR